MDIKELIRQFEEIMSATTFAEAGEFDTARKILTERHKVLLVLTGMESDMKAARFALNISSRIGAGIEILYIISENDEKDFLESYLKELKAKGIEYQVTKGEGSLKEEIIKFINTMKDKDIYLVVVDSQDLGIPSEKDQKIHLDEWKSLQCPIVLVSELAKT